MITPQDRKKIQQCMDLKQKFFMKAFEALQKNEDSVPYWNIEQSFIVEITNILEKYNKYDMVDDVIDIPTLTEDVNAEIDDETTD
jgi:hypothetical protein